MAGWYIRRGEKIVGPVEIPKLQELVAGGRLLPTDQLAKDVSGPWKEAGSTTLFAKPKSKPAVTTPPPQPTSLVPKPEAPLPVVVDQPEQPEGNKAVTQVLRVVHTVFGGVGRGMLVTWGAASRSIATRSQRKHEIKLAKIQADTLKSQHPPAQQSQPSAPPAAVPAVFAPQIHQTTVVQVVNKNKQSVYGCSGCGVILLLILIGLIILAIMDSATPH